MKRKRLLILPQLLLLLLLISDHYPLLTQGFLPASSSSSSSSSACWSIFRKGGCRRGAGMVIIDLIDLIDPAARNSRTFSNCKLVASTEARLSRREDNDGTLGSNDASGRSSGVVQQEQAGPVPDPDPDHLLQVAVKSNDDFLRQHNKLVSIVTDEMERHSSLSSSSKSSSASVLSQDIVLPGVAGLTFLASARALLIKRRRIRSREGSVGTSDDSNSNRNEKSGTGTARDGVSPFVAVAGLATILGTAVVQDFYTSPSFSPPVPQQQQQQQSLTRNHVDHQTPTQHHHHRPSVLVAVESSASSLSPTGLSSLLSESSDNQILLLRQQESVSPETSSTTSPPPRAEAAATTTTKDRVEPVPSSSSSSPLSTVSTTSAAQSTLTTMTTTPPKEKSDDSSSTNVATTTATIQESSVVNDAKAVASDQEQPFPPPPPPPPLEQQASSSTSKRPLPVHAREDKSIHEANTNVGGMVGGSTRNDNAEDEQSKKASQQQEPLLDGSTRLPLSNVRVMAESSSGGTASSSNNNNNKNIGASQDQKQTSDNDEVGGTTRVKVAAKADESSLLLDDQSHAAVSTKTNIKNDDEEESTSRQPKSSESSAPKENVLPSIGTKAEDDNSNNLEELLVIKQLLKGALMEKLAGSTSQADELKQSNAELQLAEEPNEKPRMVLGESKGNTVMNKPATAVKLEEGSNRSANPVIDKASPTKQTITQDAIVVSPSSSTRTPANQQEDRSGKAVEEASQKVTTTSSAGAVMPPPDPRVSTQSPSRSAVAVPDKDRPSNPQAVATAAALLVGTVVGSGYVATNAFKTVSEWVGARKPTNGTDSETLLNPTGAFFRQSVYTANAVGQRDGNEGSERDQSLFRRLFGKGDGSRSQQQIGSKEGGLKSKLFGFLQNEALEKDLSSSTGVPSLQPAPNRHEREGANPKEGANPIENGPPQQEQPKWGVSAIWASAPVESKKPEPPNTDQSEESDQGLRKWAGILRRPPLGASEEFGTTSKDQETSTDTSQTKWNKDWSPIRPKEPPNRTSLGNEVLNGNGNRDESKVYRPFREPPSPPVIKTPSASTSAVIDEYERRIAELMQETPSISTRALVDEYQRRIVELRD